MPTIALSSMMVRHTGGPLAALRWAVENGFRGMEMSARFLAPEQMPPADLRSFRALAASKGVDLAVHAPSAWAPATFEHEQRNGYLAEMDTLLRRMAQIGARVVVLHEGKVQGADVETGKVSEEMRHHALENLTEFLRLAAPAAKETGVVICLENLPYIQGAYDSYGIWRCYDVIKTYPELAQVVRDADSHVVRICLDVGHADRAEGIRPAFEEFAPLLRHIHIHDSDGERDHQEIGTSKVDFASYGDLLKPFPNMMVMEMRGGDDPVGVALRSRDRLKDVLGDAAR